MGFLPKLNKATFVGALLSSIGGVYFPPPKPGRKIQIRYKSAPESKRQAAMLHPTSGWKGPGTISRGTNRRRLVAEGALMFFPRVNRRKETRRLQHCANLLREQADELDKSVMLQEMVMGDGVFDNALVVRRENLITRANKIEPNRR